MLRWIFFLFGMMIALSFSMSSEVAQYLPPTDTISCDATNDGVRVRFRESSEHYDAYEVGLSRFENESDFPIVAKRARNASDVLVRSALSSFAYFASVRPHIRGRRSYSVGNWGPRGKGLECAPVAIDSSASKASHLPSRLDPTSFRFPVVRQSEFTNAIDYLSNHDSGDVLGDAAFLTVSAAASANSSLINVSFSNATFSLYCVEARPARLNFSTRSGNETMFADYVSCNFENPTPSDPSCVCQCWADRQIAGDTRADAVCHKVNAPGVKCSWDDTGYNCTCPCSHEGIEASERYIGFMPVYMADDGLRTGSWYSHPAAGECLFDDDENEESCTWRILGNEIRAIRGTDLVDFHFAFDEKNESDVIRLNAAVLDRAFVNLPLEPFKCV